MMALCVLAVIFIWALLGFTLWSRLVKPYVYSTILRACLTLLLAAVWFVGPVLDEILGTREFDKLCAEMPSIKFYGPVAVGAGVFFDEQGRPKWKNSDEFAAIVRKSGESNRMFGEPDEWKKIVAGREERRTIRKWPMPIIEMHTVYFERATGKIILESFARYSAGGWLRRLVGIGDYQCPIKGRYPNEEEWIFYKK